MDTRINGILKALLLAAVVLVAFTGCKRGDDRARPSKKTKEVYQKETNLRYAARAIYEGIQAYRQGRILEAAQKFGYAVTLTADINDFRLFPKAPPIKADAHFWYGLTVMDIYRFADKSSLAIYDEKGRKIGEKASPEIAMQHIERAIELYPAPALYYFGKGYVYLHSGDPNTAIKWFNSAIGRDNGNPDFYANRGLAYYMLARDADSMSVRGPYMKLAQDDALRALSINDRHYLANVLLVRLYIMADDLKSAKMVIQDMADKNLPVDKVLAEYEKAMRKR